MKILLLSDVAGFGKKGEVKDVSDGYAKNFLIPKKFALLYDNSVACLVAKDASLKEKVEKNKSALSEKISSLILEFQVQSHDDGCLYGSIKSEDIVKKIYSDHHISLSAGQILLEKPLKKLGSYLVHVKLSNVLRAKLKLRLLAL